MPGADPLARDPLVVLTTLGEEERARTLAAELVASRLAGCVNVIPGIRSVYRWKGEMAEDAEVLLVIKTHRDRFADLRERILARHPYEIPELIALPIADGSAAYLAWLAGETRPERTEEP